MTLFRFVGGPWHNRHVEASGCKAVDVETRSRDAPWPAGEICFRHRYFLCWFRTERGTMFFQYVHESLCDGGCGREPEPRKIPTFRLEVSL